MTQSKPSQTKSQTSRLTVPTSTSIPKISVSDSVASVSYIVSQISHSLQSRVFEVLVDVPVSITPNLISEISNVASDNISSFVSHNLPNVPLPAKVASIPHAFGLNIDFSISNVYVKLSKQSYILPDIPVNFFEESTCDLFDISMQIDDHDIQHLTGLSLLSKSSSFKFRDVQSVLSSSSTEHANVNLETLAGNATVSENMHNSTTKRKRKSSKPF